MDFKEKLQSYQKIVNDELQKYLRKENGLEEVLHQSMEYSLMAGGKRLRPILVLATYKLLNDADYKKCLPYAVAIEMVHNFSLIHDDLPGIDNDDFRHGKLTNHKKFNEATAILAGDALLNNAYIVISNDLKQESIEDLEHNKKDFMAKLLVFNEFSIAVDKMIAGEYVDTAFEGKNISIQDLEYIHKNKTGALLTLCVRMGAILAGASQDDLQNLTQYSQKIGLAFQVKDDILSEEGDEKELGKPVGNDKERCKCTYVSKYGLDGAKDILNDLIEQAIKCLDKYDKKAEFLKSLAEYIRDRKK